MDVIPQERFDVGAMGFCGTILKTAGIAGGIRIAADRASPAKTKAIAEIPAPAGTGTFRAPGKNMCERFRCT